MATLSLKKVPVQIDEFEEVAVPEFGMGEDGEALIVRVRPLTVSTHSILNAMTAAVRLDRVTNSWVPTTPHDASSVAAALCSYDDEDELVFGVDYMDAIARVESLHARYRPAILRIANKAVELSKFADKEGEPVEAASKN